MKVNRGKQFRLPSLHYVGSIVRLPMKTPTILLADDHEVCRDGLRQILEPEFKVVASVGDGRRMVSESLKLRPDIIVAGITLPLLNGIEAARRIKKKNSRTKILFLTMHVDTVYATAAMRAGASAYVLKKSGASEILKAIRTVLSGFSYISPLIRSRLAESKNNGRSGNNKVHELTSRQREVLQLVAEGRSAKEIAAVLNVSHRTIEFHKQRIMEELGIHTTAELTRFAIKHRVLTA